MTVESDGVNRLNLGRSVAGVVGVEPAASGQ